MLESLDTPSMVHGAAVLDHLVRNRFAYGRMK